MHAVRTALYGHPPAQHVLPVGSNRVTDQVTAVAGCRYALTTASYRSAASRGDCGVSLVNMRCLG